MAMLEINSDGWLYDPATGEKIDVYHPLSVDSIFNPADFRVILLRKRNVKESEIVQVFHKKKRIGWCFPVQSISSKEHSYFDNEHFLRYATVAGRVILSSNWFDGKVDYPDPYVSQGELSYSHFFHPFSCLLVISLETLHGADFILNDWLVSLGLYGFFVADESVLPNLRGSLLESEKGILKIEKIAPLLSNNEFLHHVFCGILPFEKNELCRFFLLYQVIELLMEKVLMYENKKFVADLTVYAKDALRVKSILSKIRDIVSEEKRINILFGKFSDPCIDLSDVNSCCGDFLRESNVDDVELSGMGGPEKIYRARNIIFHGYRNVHETKYMSSLSDSLIICVSRLVCRFKAEEEDLSSSRYSRKHDFLEGFPFG